MIVPGKYRTNNFICNHTFVLGALHTIQHMMDHEHKSVIEKTWKENQDYYKVEPTIICHDGESIQVS